MAKHHIAFFVIPAPPHVNPTLSLVSTLVSRGYRVTYVTSDQFQPILSKLGADVVLCSRLSTGSDAKPDPALLQKWWTWDEIGRAYPGFIDVAQRTLSETTGRYEEDRPDIILYDSLCFAGRVLAERWGIPAVQTSPVFGFHDVYFTRKEGVCYTPKGFEEFGKKLDEFFHGHDVHSVNNLFHKERLNILFFPKEFQFESASFDHRFYFAGRCIAERPSQGEWSKISDNEQPLILVSPSTTYYSGPEYFRMLFDATRDLPWKVVMSTGGKVDRSTLGTIPEHVEIHKYLPYPKVLPHVWLTICQGGTSTVVEAMYHGVAMICISFSDELAEYSNRVQELGLGVHIRRTEMTTGGVRSEILRIAEDASMLSRVKQMQRTIRSEEGGAKDVADRIERYIGQHSGQLPPAE